MFLGTCKFPNLKKTIPAPPPPPLPNSGPVNMRQKLTVHFAYTFDSTHEVIRDNTLWLLCRYIIS